jgi:hypothetical protein
MDKLRSSHWAFLKPEIQILLKYLIEIIRDTASSHIFALSSACKAFNFSMSVAEAGHSIPRPSVGFGLGIYGCSLSATRFTHVASKLFLSSMEDG